MPPKCVFLLPILAVLLGYYFHSPLPDNITDPWAMKFIIGGYRLVNLITNVGVSVGYDSGINMSRSVFAQAFKWTSQPVHPLNVKVEKREVNGVPVQIFSPTDREPKELFPVIVYFHGGGFITFTVDTYENILLQMTQDTHAIVIAMEYRLAPEHPFPAPLDDCHAVAKNILTNAANYGGDVNRVALAGDSAGGNLAAAVAWRLANDPASQKVSTPKLQILLYPMLQAFDFQLPSYVDLNGITHEVVTSEGFAGAWCMYCTGKVHTIPGILANNHTSSELKQSKYARYLDTNNIHIPDQTPRRKAKQSDTFDNFLAKEFQHCVTNPEFSPLMADDVAKFPRTYIMSAEYDILKDECFIFADRLRKAGVNVHHDYIRGGWHGIVSYTQTQGGRDALRNVINYVKENL